MARSSKRWMPIAVAAMLAVVVSACSSSASSGNASGGSSGSASDGASAIPAAACKSAPTGTPYTVGVISSDTGSAVLQGKNDLSSVISAWQKFITCQGGINGHRVKVIYKDDKSDPATSVAAAKAMINQKAIALLDNTALSSGWYQYADAAKVPVICLNACNGTARYLTDPNFYATQDVFVYGMWGFTKAASFSGKKKLGMLYCAELAACQSLPKLVGPLAKQSGMEMVYSAGFSATAPNYTAQCLAAKAKGVEVFAPIGETVPVDRVLSDCAKQGYYPIAVWSGAGLGADSSQYSSFAPAVYGASGPIPFFVHNEATKDFDTYVGPYIDSSGFKNSGQATTRLQGDWIGLQTFAEAARNLGKNPTAAGVTAALEKFDGSFDNGGMSVPLDFRPGHPRGNCVFPFSVIKSKYSVINGGKPICAPASILSILKSS